MAATADPRAKPPAPPPTHHLEPWARQKQQPPPPPHARDRRRQTSSSRAGQDDGGIDELRAKLMGHIRDAADRLRVSSHGPKSPPPPPPPRTHGPGPPPDPEPTPPPPPPASQHQQEADKPWKLRERTRRRPAALASWPSAAAQRRRGSKRAPFSVALTPEEIEEDIYALTGGRPRRRPRKRPRGAQRQLDSLFPGLWLTEITADDYRVPDE